MIICDVGLGEFHQGFKLVLKCLRVGGVNGSCWQGDKSGQLTWKIEHFS